MKTTTYEAVDKFGEIEKGSRKNRWGDNNKYIVFNDNGNEIEKSGYNSDGSLKYKYTYKYDDNGNRIEGKSKRYNSDGSSKYKRTYKYDDNGNTIKKKWYNSEGSFKSVITYKYDDNGNEIETKMYNSDGSLEYKYTYKYECDNKDNWINKIEYENKIPTVIIEREIEYFE
jgi:antitoxin component YwqK of YwqJK toxin-antitoxin module